MLPGTIVSVAPVSASATNSSDRAPVRGFSTRMETRTSPITNKLYPLLAVLGIHWGRRSLHTEPDLSA
jgi:hypothetical protein